MLCFVIAVFVSATAIAVFVAAVPVAIIATGITVVVVAAAAAITVVIAVVDDAYSIVVPIVIVGGAITIVAVVAAVVFWRSNTVHYQANVTLPSASVIAVSDISWSRLSPIHSAMTYYLC